VTEDIELVANFYMPDGGFFITVGPMQGGTTNPFMNNQSTECGEEFLLEAIPNTGYAFVG